MVEIQEDGGSKTRLHFEQQITFTKLMYNTKQLFLQRFLNLDRSFKIGLTNTAVIVNFKNHSSIKQRTNNETQARSIFRATG
jgi:hypothetical protein